ncbi:hypothetical protein ACS0TY_026060 [Phlomoides rotata]
MASIVDSRHLKSVPSKFKYVYDETALSCDSFPVVDFSALSAADPDQRSKAIYDISKACEEWGFFILENHGVPEELMIATFSALKDFFSLGEDEKKEYAGKSGVDPLYYVAFDMNDVPNQPFSLWREKLWLDVHPKFYCPHKPQSLRAVLVEYNERSKELSRKIMEAISESLQLEHQYVDRVLGLDSSYEFVVANYYPPCPHPDQVIGIVPHTDASLFTLLIHNGVPGLQIENQGRWYNVDSPRNSILVIVSDQLEIFSNGRYKSLNHRVVVNEERERMSIGLEYGPSKEATIGPDAAFVEKDGRAMYRSIKYGEFIDRVFKYSEHLPSYRQ